MSVAGQEISGGNNSCMRMSIHAQRLVLWIHLHRSELIKKNIRGNIVVVVARKCAKHWKRTDHGAVRSEHAIYFSAVERSRHSRCAFKQIRHDHACADDG